MDGNLNALTTIFTEFYYWVTVVFMFLIHVGFCMYEVGASRRRNHLHTLIKNIMIIPLVTVTFFFFGWWIYWTFPSAFPGIGGIDFAAGTPYTPWSENMGTNLEDRITGVFWAAFLLFSWTAASIVSGSVIERIRSSALWLHAVMIGSVWWIIDAAWGWHWDGWMVKVLGYHDAYASGVIHAIAGGYALGLLLVLGPRIGKFAADGTPRDIPPHNPWLLTIGIFLIYTGFWGFYAACNVPIISPEVIDGQITGTTWTATNIYLAPTTLSAITFNFLMSLSGGLMAAYIVSKGDPFWTFSGGLAGIITASAGNDLYHPIQAMLVAAIGVVIVYRLHFWVERKFKIDDAVGAVAVHGYSGVVGLIIAGFVLWGAPSSPYDGYAAVNPLGQLIGAVIMFGLLGFLPGWGLAKIQQAAGVLRIPREVELQGLDFSENRAFEAAQSDVINAEKAAVAEK
ncbi:MAG: ammonium transporter [Marinovum sp.]|nr:ammonium transporter [Marinovum sp.]MBT4828978.1 ammonium transporter [Marinovum sp.]MDG1257893.1 ammonium transporter [Paracoccaceae bacterium]MDG1318723.1 ammonium transporter [Paracoccaceae bacterium]